ncbi:multifunctional 2',3'-cyclic-nucleotide 2'-phosphodiesterase/5'-nucleotidase/3'-nucleotidase [Aurantimonas aggregata]|uniref:Multifunctional 2',3'-cyclic-nucleotide 2'-phosphodiesterase/5'-nucleotidase/3'-nucleotidase n=1 Tax=Aurantimonas aggregata TaxID=2047720 RepID=A0A6L9MF66_9HYPH|nr:5'-nucleotidase C-terminal domain-containing protein [Aurantimonas aggregata]NDV86489.1 multifunctional 2',3'-cyclic-nucleotide 2'-phosphodiesterase/5'-nucleotidase/3'-nucleotidase [Aurantimonas aggregata]
MRLLFSTAAALAIVAAAGGIARAEFRLTILHTNDFHSRIEPINKYDSTCSAEEATADECFGGSARLFTAIRAARESATNPILVDGGDQFQGSLFYNQYKGAAAAEMMNAIGYDAMTVGNHEFDDGPEVLRAFIEAVDFPILLANADVSKEPELAETLKPSTVIERDGEKIGLVGVTPVDTAELSSPGPNITFEEPVAALTEAVKALTDQGVDKIVVLSHSGYEADQRIAAAVPGIDVIVGGHSHTLLANNDDKAAGPYPTMVEGPDGHDVPIVQAYAYGKYLGELVVMFDDAGVVTEASGTPLIMNGTIPQDSTLLARIDELAKPLEAIRTEVVASTAAPLDGSREVCRVSECSMGNLVADAMLDRVRDQGASLAITNGGGLRASIDQGEVTMGEVLTVLPFQNTLSTFKLTGADIKAALENGVSQVEEGGGRFPQVSGLKFTWSKTAAPGSRIDSVEVKEGDAFVPLDPAKTYLVVSNNFLRGGGDGYSVFAEKGLEAYDYGPTLEDVVAAYLSRDTAPYEPYTDGRITAAE